MFLVGFCGCCGAVRESKCLLGFVSSNSQVFIASLRDDEWVHRILGLFIHTCQMETAYYFAQHFAVYVKIIKSLLPVMCLLRQ